MTSEIQALGEENVDAMAADHNAVVEPFFGRIHDDLAAGVSAARITPAEAMLQIRRRYLELLTAGGQELDETARRNLHYTSAIFAAYDVLDEHFDRAALIAGLTAAFVEPLAPAVAAQTRAMLDAADDPFRAMVDYARSREGHDFGGDFRFEHPVDDADRFFADVHRCGFHTTLSAHGAPELTKVLCAFDAAWINAINPKRDGFTFDRATTIGHGGRMCPFHFQRTTISSHDTNGDGGNGEAT